MIWILMPEQIDGPMKSPIVFLQTLLFTGESVWKKNESQKSSIFEIFHEYGIQKSNKILFVPIEVIQNEEQSGCNRYFAYSFYFFMCYECPQLPSKNWPFLRCVGENLEEKRFLKIVFLPDFLWILAIFCGKVAIFW